MMNAPRILVTGATGNVGSAVLALLVAARAPVLAAVRSEDTRVPSGAEVVRFDFHDPATFHAFQGVERVFLMRPPAMSNARRDLGPAIAAMKAAGVRQVVFLSLLGAEKNTVVPHHAKARSTWGGGPPGSRSRPTARRCWYRISCRAGRSLETKRGCRSSRQDRSRSRAR
jgi:uncharacterized protein YbjT (DUF2867 family)